MAGVSKEIPGRAGRQSRHPRVAERDSPASSRHNPIRLQGPRAKSGRNTRRLPARASVILRTTAGGCMTADGAAPACVHIWLRHKIDVILWH